MESRYRWDDVGVRALRDAAEGAHRALVDASVLTNQLVADMEADATWTAEHKVAFMAWMDLLRQFHERLAGPDVGLAAVEALDSFLARLSGYYADSDVYASLGEVR
jgi:hypothetical protein